MLGVPPYIGAELRIAEQAQLRARPDRVRQIRQGREALTRASPSGDDDHIRRPHGGIDVPQIEVGFGSRLCSLR